MRAIDELARGFEPALRPPSTFAFVRLALALILASAIGCAPVGDSSTPDQATGGSSGKTGGSTGSGGSKPGSGGNSGSGGSSSSGGNSGSGGSSASGGGNGSGGQGGEGGSSSPDGGGDAAAGGSSGTGGGGGTPSNGTHAKMIKLDTTTAGAGVMGDVPKYPVAVVLDAMNFDFTTAKPKGEDILFATAEGAALPYAIELWDAAAKRAAIWVKVDVKGNATQMLKMTWGDAAATDASAPETVFDVKDGFTGVWHLSDPGSATPDGYKDSTANAAHGSGVATTAESTGPGRVGNAVLLANAKQQWVQIGLEKSKLYDDQAKMTYSIWSFAKTHTVDYQCMFSKGEKSFRIHYFGTSTTVETCAESGAGQNDLCPVNTKGIKVVNGQWFHLLAVHDFPKHAIYVNGVLQAEATEMGSFISDPTKAVMIGNNASNTKRAFDGFLDEARLMNVPKDANWIKLEYESQKEGQKFLSVLAGT
jgi:hypothetical protein